MAYRDRSAERWNERRWDDPRSDDREDYRAGREDYRGRRADNRSFSGRDEPYLERSYGGDAEGWSRYQGYNNRQRPFDWQQDPRYDSTFRESGSQRSHLRCRDIMTLDVVSCRSDTPVQEVARMMRDHDVGAIPVVDENRRLSGIVTDRDIVVRALTSDKPETELVAGGCMSDDVYTANQNERVADVIRHMGDHQVRRIPVVDGRNRLVGMISIADVALMTDRDQELADAFHGISRPSSFLGRLANFFNL